jgi:hypothetical protein
MILAEHCKIRLRRNSMSIRMGYNYGEERISLIIALVL